MLASGRMAAAGGHCMLWWLPNPLDEHAAAVCGEIDRGG